MGNLVLLKRETQQCEGTTKAGARCTFNARQGTKLCGKHEPKDLDPVESVGEMTTAQKLEAAKQQVMDLVPAAMEALVSILNDPLTKPSDRLKAIEMVMNRAVAQKIEADVSNSDVRDIDAEIDEVLAEVAEDLRTGTDG